MADRTTMDFGSKLRDARERRGVSLRAIADATKISVAVLEALERNDVSRLPGGIFSRAFVRSYATEVGLDPEATIQEFVAQFPQDSVTAGHPAAPPETSSGFDEDRGVSRTVVRLILIAVPLVALLVYFGSGRRLPWRSSTAAAPAAVAEAKPGEALPSPPAPTTTVSAAPTETPTTAATAAAEAPAPPPAASDKLQVAVSARKPCWVSATVDGRKAIEQLLQAGDERTVDIQREMVLTAGDASAIALTLNGEAGRPLGKSGEVVTVRVNPTNFKEYLASR